MFTFLAITALLLISLWLVLRARKTRRASAQSAALLAQLEALDADWTRFELASAQADREWRREHRNEQRKLARQSRPTPPKAKPVLPPASEKRDRNKPPKSARSDRLPERSAVAPQPNQSSDARHFVSAPSVLSCEPDSPKETYVPLRPLGIKAMPPFPRSSLMQRFFRAPLQITAVLLRIVSKPLSPLALFTRLLFKQPARPPLAAPIPKSRPDPAPTRRAA